MRDSTFFSAVNPARLRVWAGVWVLVLSWFGASEVARAAEFHVNREQPRSVTFLSDAPIEDFEGVTSAIDGYIIWEDDSLVSGRNYEGSEFYFEVLLAELDTGIDMRNRHMRDNYLHTEDYPYATYAGTIDSVRTISDTAWQVFTAGTLTVHGVEQHRGLRCDVTRQASGFLVQSSFTVKLTDHDIEIPSLMFMKISEDIVLTLKLRVDPVE